MTREEAYYERLKLLCGEWDTYDEWLTKHMTKHKRLIEKLKMHIAKRVVLIVRQLAIKICRRGC